VTKTYSILLMSIAVPLVFAAAYLASPVLLSPQAVVDERSGEHVERARRMVMQYGQNVDRLGVVLAQLESHGVDTSLQMEDVDRIIESNMDTIDQADEVLTEVSRGVSSSRRRDLDETFRAAGGTSEVSLSLLSRIGGNSTTALRNAREGLRVRDRILSENERLLDDALAEVNAAIAVSEGDASAAQDPRANRLKGIILVAQSRVLERRMNQAYAAVDGPRAELVELASTVTRFEEMSRVEDRSQIQQRIEAMEDAAADLRARIKMHRERYDIVQRTIEDLETRIDRATGFVHEARAAMDEMERLEANLLDHYGAERFAQDYEALSKTHREASAVAHRLRYGTLVGARIDDSGDYLKGSFVLDDGSSAIVEKRGLVDYEHDLETAQLDIDGLESTLADLQTNLDEMTALAERYRSESASAGEAVERTKQRAAGVYSSLSAKAQEGDELAEKAIQKARGAIQVLRTAASSAGTDARDARDALDLVGPTRQDKSPLKLQADAKWVAGQLNNELAQARYQLGRVMAARYVSASGLFDAARIAKSAFGLGDADPAAFATIRDTAREEGGEALRDAIRDFDKSFRDLSSNWTVPAEAGAAHDLLATLEHPGHVATAIQNYQQAADGAAGQLDSTPISTRLEQLRRR
jgi:chromosome segregation ATPase